jgi:hypothetical protein
MESLPEVACCGFCCCGIILNRSKTGSRWFAAWIGDVNGEGRHIVTAGESRRPCRMIGALAAACVVLAAQPAPAQPVCDAADEGYRVVPSVEVTGVEDGAPYRAGADWVLDRVTTRLPMCSYFTPVGSFSLKSYSLDPYKTTERVTLCAGASAVVPYTGPCPPK